MVKYHCDYCNAIINVPPFNLKTNKHHFCNKQCFDNYQRQIKTKQFCENCGKEIYKRPSYVKNRKHLFCSIKCSKQFYKYIYMIDNKFEITENEIYIFLPPDYKMKCIIDKDKKDLLTNYKFVKCGLYVDAKNRETGKRIKLHRLIMNCPKNMVVDHINHNTLDNRKCNLRICTTQENSLNRDDCKNVYFAKDKNKYCVKFMINKKVKYYGYYVHQEEALKVAKEIRKKLKSF